MHSRDKTHPSCTLTVPGGPLSGIVRLTATASDNRELKWLTLWLDGVKVATSSVPPGLTTYSADFNLDTSKSPDGLHSLQARANDPAGNIGYSSVVSILFKNSAALPVPSLAGVGTIRVSPTGDDAYSYALNKPYSYFVLHDRPTAWPYVHELHQVGAKVLAYKNGPFTTPWDAVQGVTEAEAEANGWFLLDAAGQRINSYTWKANWLLDIGAPGYADLWANNVISACKAHGYDGVFLDDADDGYSMGPHLFDGIRWRWPVEYPAGGVPSVGVPPGGYSVAWQAAMDLFLYRVGTMIKAAGLLVIPNIAAGAWWVEDGLLRWGRWSGYCSGAHDEYFCKNGNDARPPFSNINNAWLNRVKRAERTTGFFLGHFKCPKDDLRNQRYVRASSLLANYKPGDATMYEPNPETEPWDDTWTIDLGAPLAPRYELVAGTLWRRNFANGYVVLNTNPIQTISGIAPLDAQLVRT